LTIESSITGVLFFSNIKAFQVYVLDGNVSLSSFKIEDLKNEKLDMFQGFKYSAIIIIIIIIIDCAVRNNFIFLHFFDPFSVGQHETKFCGKTTNPKNNNNNIPGPSGHVHCKFAYTTLHLYYSCFLKCRCI
jgi:hypothetical protein